MDSFESVVATLLGREGFWVRSSFKVELTKAEKVEIGRQSSPRWELDLVAYRALTNELLIVECKSYVDSIGVAYAPIFREGSDPKSRYKLFREPVLRRVVFARLVEQLEATGAILPNPKARLCLAAAKMKSANDREKIREKFVANEWLLFDDKWLRQGLEKLAVASYENDVATLVTKLLRRNAG